MQEAARQKRKAPRVIFNGQRTIRTVSSCDHDFKTLQVH
jgi:hypothetical protein